jgi:hypothetical protein
MTMEKTVPGSGNEPDELSGRAGSDESDEESGAGIGRTWCLKQ